MKPRARVSADSNVRMERARGLNRGREAASSVVRVSKFEQVILSAYRFIDSRAILIVVFFSLSLKILQIVEIQRNESVTKSASVRISKPSLHSSCWNETNFFAVSSPRQGEGRKVRRRRAKERR